MKKVNFLEETISVLNKIGKTPNDIAWIGSKDGEYSISWEEFQELSNLEYNPGYGCAEIPEDLVIVFKDNSWLERKEYDGAEWWEYLQPPKLNKNPKKIKKLYEPGKCWYKIKDINEIE